MNLGEVRRGSTGTKCFPYYEGGRGVVPVEAHAVLTRASKLPASLNWRRIKRKFVEKLVHSLAKARKMDCVLGLIRLGPAPPDSRRGLLQDLPRRCRCIHTSDRGPTATWPDRAQALGGSFSDTYPVGTERRRRPIGRRRRLDRSGQGIVAPGDHHVAAAPEDK